jgi:hypothetical protein
MADVFLTPPQKLELRSLDYERFTQAVNRESSIQNRPQFLLPLLPAQRGWGANHTLSELSPATACDPTGVAPRTSPARSVSVPAGGSFQKRSLNWLALGVIERVI